MHSKEPSVSTDTHISKAQSTTSSVESLEDTLLPVRSVNAFAFCPRLFWLEHVEGVFEDNAHTLEGSSMLSALPLGIMVPTNESLLI